MRSNITTTPAARATGAASSFTVQEPKPKETAVGRLMRELHARGLLDGYRPRRGGATNAGVSATRPACPAEGTAPR